MAEDIQETTILAKNLPPRLPGNKLALQYRIESPSAEVSNWSPVYYVSAPSISNATSNSLVATNATTFTLTWSDSNLEIEEYDIFGSFSIDAEDFTVNVRSVDTTKYIYFPTSNALISTELSKFKVGTKIDVVGMNAALNGVDLEVTEVNVTAAQYYIQFTGDSSNTLGNTSTTNGYFIMADGYSVTDFTLTNYEYLGTVQSFQNLKNFLFEPITMGSTTRDRAHALIQVACSEKSADSSLTIARTNRVSLI